LLLQTVTFAMLSSDGIYIGSVCLIEKINCNVYFQQMYGNNSDFDTTADNDNDTETFGKFNKTEKTL